MTPRPQPSSSRRLEDALRLAAAGRWTAARRRVLSSLGRDGPGHEEERAAAAKTLAEVAARAAAAGEVDEAERSLRGALRLAPRFADLHYRLARLLERAERHEEASQALRAALAINPNYLAARVDLALLEARLGRLGEALEELRRLEQRRRPDEMDSFRQGLRLMEQADWEEATALLHRAYGLSEGGLEGEVARFMELVRQGEVQRARLLLRGVVKRHPDYPDLHYLLGRVELEQGYADDAVASFAQALELNPNFHAARVELARALEALGQIASAQEQVQGVLQHDPAHPAALRWREHWARRGEAAAPHKPLDREGGERPE